MAKEGKTPLAIKATASAAFLKAKGFQVPTSVVCEMFARSEGFSSYAAYKACIDSASKAKTEMSSFTKVLRFLDTDEGLALIHPSCTAFYDVAYASSFVDVIRYAPYFLDTERVSNIEWLLPLEYRAKMRLTAVLEICPNRDRYGSPDSSWLTGNNSFKFIPTALAETVDDLIDIHDMGDDSAGSTMIEVAVSDEMYAEILAKQDATYKEIAENIVDDIKSKAEKFEFNASINSLIRQEYADEIPDVPRFFEIVASL